MDDIHARKPINKTAAMVFAKGVSFESSLKDLVNDQSNPFLLKDTRSYKKISPSFVDLTGVKFGRFTVLGMADGMKKRWVVRCSCGWYSTRCKKAITNEKNCHDMCEQCRYLIYLKCSEYERRTGASIKTNTFLKSN